MLTDELTPCVESPPGPADTELDDWETAAGSADGTIRPRVLQADFIYLGDQGDPHWYGQPCYLTSQPALPGERHVAMACGCRAFVPQSTLKYLTDIETQASR